MNRCTSARTKYQMAGKPFLATMLYIGIVESRQRPMIKEKPVKQVLEEARLKYPWLFVSSGNNQPQSQVS